MPLVPRLLWPTIFLFGVSPALGDKVHLKDGRKLSGTAERNADSVELTTDDGRHLSFARDEVKRVVFESVATPKMLLEMLDEFETRIAPAMGLGEPRQKDFGKTTRKTRVRNDLFDGRGFDVSWEGGLAREVVDSDRFVDEWVRFAAHFEATAKTRTYKHHTRAARRKTSLAEFGRYPPEELEELGEVVRDAIEAVKKTFELAKRASLSLGALRAEDVRYDRKIARAADRARRISADRSVTSGDKSLARAETAKLKDQQTVRMKEMQLQGDNAINAVAANRIIAIHLLDELRTMLLAEVGAPQRSTLP